MPLQVFLEIISHPEFRRRYEDDFRRFVLAEEIYERARRAAVLEITDDGDSSSVYFAELSGEGVHVKKGLGRMLTRAVSGIYDRYRRRFGKAFRRIFLEMADDDDIRVLAHDAAGVLQSFSFHRRRNFVRVFRTDDVSAKPHHGGFEREPRTRRGLIKKRGQYLAS